MNQAVTDTLNRSIEVDEYIAGHLIQADAALEKALQSSKEANLPSIQVSPCLGKLLHLLVLTHGSRRILEIGTLGGYSTIWMAKALPAGGRLISLELDHTHAEVARKNIEHAELSDRVEIRLGAALDTLPKIASEGLEPFDFFFIDADKQNIPEYFQWALKISRPGSVIVVDNVVRRGELINSSSDDQNVQGVRRLHEMLATELRATATTIQTVGSKGYDGFTLAVVTASGAEADFTA